MGSKQSNTQNTTSNTTPNTTSTPDPIPIRFQGVVFNESYFVIEYVV